MYTLFKMLKKYKKTLGQISVELIGQKWGGWEVYFQCKILNLQKKKKKQQQQTTTRSP